MIVPPTEVGSVLPENSDGQDDKKDPDIIFTEKLGDVYYQVHVWRIESSFQLALPMYNSFECLVKALFPEINTEKQIVIAHGEFGKCVLRARRELGDTV